MSLDKRETLLNYDSFSYILTLFLNKIQTSLIFLLLCEFFLLFLMFVTTNFY